MTLTIKTRNKNHTHRQWKAAFSSLANLQETVYLTLTMGPVIEKRWEYNQDKATVFTYFEKIIWQDKHKKYLVLLKKI